MLNSTVALLSRCVNVCALAPSSARVRTVRYELWSAQALDGRPARAPGAGAVTWATSLGAGFACTRTKL